MTKSEPKPITDDRPIWWLASYPKSGNTWVRAFLSSYLHGAEDLNNLQGVTADNQPYFHQSLAHRPLTELGTWDLVVVHNLALLHMLSVMRMSEPYLLKTHNANLSFGGTPLIPWPITKGAIYIARDPRDVAVSYSDHFGCSLDDAVTSLGKKQNRITQENGLFHILSDWSSHIKSWMEQKTFRTGLLRYEDLLINPAQKFEGILKYLGVEKIDQARFDRALKFSSFDSLRKIEEKTGFQEVSKKSAGKFFREGKAGGWQKVLTEEQVARIEADHGDQMRELGYDLVCRAAA